MRTRVRRYLAVPLLLAALSTAACTSACVKAPPNLTTTEGRRAFYADQAIMDIGHLQTAVIDAQQNGAINTQTAKVLATFTVSALETIKASPGGWLPTVTAAWTQVKQQVPAIRDNPVVEGYAATVDVLLQAAAAHQEP